MKGHGATVELDEATLHFYRRSGGLAQKTVFQILKPFLVEGGEMAQQARAILTKPTRWRSSPSIRSWFEGTR